MQSVQGLWTLAILSGVSGLLFHTSCGAKKQINEGFPPSLDELNNVDYENPFWKLVREKLQIPVLKGETEAELLSTLAEPPAYFGDPDEFQAETLSQVAGHVAAAEKTVCAEIETPLADLNPGAAIGSSDGFYINAAGAPTSLSPLQAKVYRMRYKLKGDAEFRQAILTVPVSAPTGIGIQNETMGAFGYPLIMYGHGGDKGLAYTEIAQFLGQLQSTHIIAAPVFPGEPLCKTYDTGTTTCTGANIAAPALGTALPYENDVIDYLGLHDCVKTFAAGPAKATTSGVSTTEDLSIKVLKISAQARTYFASTTPPNPINVAAAGAPVTIATGIGRGAAVAGLAVAKAGAYNLTFGSGDTAAITSLVSKGVSPAMFSCSMMIAPQASIISGFNRVLLNYWVQEDSNILNSDQRFQSEFIPGFAKIHAKIKAIRADATLDDEGKANAIVAYAKSLDLLNQSSLFHYGLQNFGKVLTAQRVLATNATEAAATTNAAQGAALVLHGTQDKIAEVGNSALLTNVGTSLSALFRSQTVKTNSGVNWLGLGVTPQESVLVEDKITDLGHVSDLSFLTGNAEAAGGIESNIPIAPYENKTPAAVIAAWLSTQCVASMNANVGT